MCSAEEFKKELGGCVWTVYHSIDDAHNPMKSFGDWA